MLLPFDHVTLINLYISSYRETTGATSLMQTVPNPEYIWGYHLLVLL